MSLLLPLSRVTSSLSRASSFSHPTSNLVYVFCSVWFTALVVYVSLSRKMVSRRFILSALSRLKSRSCLRLACPSSRRTLRRATPLLHRSSHCIDGSSNYMTLVIAMSGVEPEKYMSVPSTLYNNTSVASSSPLLYECEPILVHDGLVFRRSLLRVATYSH